LQQTTVFVSYFIVVLLISQMTFLMNNVRTAGQLASRVYNMFTAVEH